MGGDKNNQHIFFKERMRKPDIVVSECQNKKHHVHVYSKYYLVRYETFRILHACLSVCAAKIKLRPSDLCGNIA